MKPYSEQKMTDFGNSDKSLSAPLIHGSGAYIMQLIRQKYGTKNPVLTPFHECYNTLNFDDFNKSVMPPQASPSYNTTGLQVVMLFYGKVSISGQWQNGNEITLFRHDNINDLSSNKRVELNYFFDFNFQMFSSSNLLFNEIQFTEDRIYNQIIALDGFLIKLD